MFTRILTACLLALSLLQASATGTVIANEALQSLPTSAHYYAEIPRRPANASVQVFNPPIFSWPYYENYGLYAQNSFYNARVYELKLGTNASLSPLLWDIISTNNFYNFLPPITNADGSTYTGTNYWSVTYHELTNYATVYSNSAVQTFQIASGAKMWDRSFWADTNYLKSVSTNHPHILFNNSNKQAINSYFLSASFEYPGRTQWRDITNDALSDIQITHWNSSLMTNDSHWYLFDNNLAQIGLVWQMTTNAAISNANPGIMMDIYATNLVRYGWDQLDGYSSGGLEQFGLAYDWLYPLLNDEQRSNAVHLLELECLNMFYSQWLFFTPPTSDRLFTNNPIVSFGCQFREGESHTRNGQNWLTQVLSGMGESATLRALLPHYLGYYYAVFDPFYQDEGHGYDSVQDLQLQRQAVPLLVLGESFPQSGITNVTMYTNIMMQFAFQQPVGYGHHKEIGIRSWGVAGGDDSQTYLSDWSNTRYYNFGLMFNDGRAMKQYQNQKPFNPSGVPVGENLIYEIFTPYYFPSPSQVDYPNAYFDAERGWAAAGTYPPSDSQSYTNGVGFIFHAQPAGTGRGNNTFVTGQWEAWAYGALLTAGGSGQYQQHTMFQNNALFVDGIGYANSPTPTIPWYARITAFTNSTDFTFVSADLTEAFNKTNYTLAGIVNIEAPFYQYSTNARPYIKNVQRSILFMHKSGAPAYFVQYDSFNTSQAAKFECKWNVWSTNITVDVPNCAFTYAATNSYNCSNVTVYVKHIVDPSLMRLTNMYSGGNLVGTDAGNRSLVNPYTGENYSGLSNPDQADNQIHYWAASEWLENRTATTNWHFMSVYYPVKWNGTAPILTALDDNTVAVNNNLGTVDTNTFGTNFLGAFTIQVNLDAVGGIEGGGGAGPSPGQGTTLQIIRATKLRIGP